MTVMTVAEKHIRHFNRMNGKEVRKDTLDKFYKKVLLVDDGGLDILRAKLKKAISKFEKDNSAIIKFKPLKYSAPAKLNGVDAGMLYGLQNIQDDSRYGGKALDGIGDTTYQVITDRILQLMKDDGLIWRKPWNEGGGGPSHLAQNYGSKHVYRGVNFYLNYLQEYPTPYYFTFDQVTKHGGKVIKGQKGWPVVYFKWLYKDIKNNKLVSEDVAVSGGKLKPGYDKIPALFYYMVFNHKQTEGIKIKAPVTKARTQKEIIASAERIIQEMPKRPELSNGPDAWYSPGKDLVQMPKLGQFKVDQHYYSVFYHELVHSTGHPKRVGREMTGRFGSKSYAFEELIAELGSSFLCGESGILYFTMKNSAAYIKNWSTKLREEMTADPKFFLRAAAHAQKAVDFMLARGEYEKLNKKKVVREDDQKVFKSGLDERETFRLLQRTFGDVGTELIQTIEKRGTLVDYNRLLNQARAIQRVDGREGESIPVEITAEALQYEELHLNKFSDFRAAVKKGGFEINEDSIKRMVDAGIHVPKDILNQALTASQKKTLIRVNDVIDELKRKTNKTIKQLYHGLVRKDLQVLKQRGFIEIDNGFPNYITEKGKLTIDHLKKKVAKTPVSKRESKRSRPPVKRAKRVKDTKENSPAVSKPATALSGFTTADQAPDQPQNLFRLPGVMGDLLGDLQRYKLEIVIAGETHSGKSEIGKQIADAFISAGHDVAWIDWEQGGLQSRDTKRSIDRNVRPENKPRFHVNSEFPKKLDAVKGLAEKFKVVVLDSGSSLKQVTNAWIDELREQHPDTVWIILMQQNEKGGTRGGSAAEFDAPVVIKTYRPDESDFRKNYAYVFKNRGNSTGLYYNIADKQVIPNPEKA